MFKLTLLFLWPRFYAQTSSLSSPFVKYLYTLNKYVLRICLLVAMLPCRRRTGRKAGGVSCFRFSNHVFDFRPNCTPLSAITIMNLFHLNSSPRNKTAQATNVPHNTCCSFQISGWLRLTQAVKRKVRNK